MKKYLLAALLLALAPAAPVGATELKITNNSMWDIYYVYVSRSSNSEWGNDQLDDKVLDAGETWRLTNIQCDTYDVKLVDEDDDTCIIPKVKLCWNTHWELDNDAWLGCVAE
ncbi:hypothetical protein H4F99_12990 [Lysobacter sp. SG-8]|uniref:DUF3757 domain-containing protein n=1 Tax=Marilutibacter penaei TaxID=2759900 RepID=A0A7W3U5N8_9GAMM|nr:hypothetical protein [Lysobacter penaei]MBB1089394.1 hypothetical protein [Lysobacter penaei]